MYRVELMARSKRDRYRFYASVNASYAGDVGRCDRRAGRDPESRMRLAAQRPLLPALQRMLLRTPLRSHSASARPFVGLHIRLPCVSGELIIQLNCSFPPISTNQFWVSPITVHRLRIIERITYRAIARLI